MNRLTTPPTKQWPHVITRQGDNAKVYYVDKPEIVPDEVHLLGDDGSLNVYLLQRNKERTEET